MWNDCGNALVITTCAMRHAILTAEKNVWIQWISEQPGKNNNFGQLAYVKPFAPYRLCLTNGGPYQRLTGPSIIRRLSTWKLSTGYNILTTSTALRQEDRPPGAQCWKVITCRVVGWRLEWRTSFLAAKMCTSQGIAISSLRWRWRRQQEERGLRRAHLPGYSQDATSWRLETLNVSSILTSLQILMAEPNPDDPLMPEIADEFRYHKDKYLVMARDWTRRHATNE